MTRETESQLIDFCVRQHGSVATADWLTFPYVEKDELAATALFLAGCDWYAPDWEPLIRIAETLHPGASKETESLYATTRFDCGRFSNMLRRELMSHAQPAS